MESSVGSINLLDTTIELPCWHTHNVIEDNLRKQNWWKLEVKEQLFITGLEAGPCVLCVMWICCNTNLTILYQAKLMIKLNDQSDGIEDWLLSGDFNVCKAIA